MCLCSFSRLWRYLSMRLKMNFKRWISSRLVQVGYRWNVIIIHNKTLFCQKVLALCHMSPPYLPGIFCKCHPTDPLIFSLSDTYPFPAPTKLKSLCLYFFCFFLKDFLNLSSLPGLLPLAYDPECHPFLPTAHLWVFLRTGLLRVLWISEQPGSTLHLRAFPMYRF